LSVEDLVKDDEWDGHFGQENGTYYGFNPPGGWYRLATKAYEHFLYFCHIYDGDEVAHPTSAIEFVWHLHMFHPILYRCVCRVSCVVCRVSCVVCRVSCVVCRVSCVVCRVS
jgi:hypothetical protein